jgi:hypothetical protein
MVSVIMLLLPVLHHGNSNSNYTVQSTLATVTAAVVVIAVAVMMQLQHLLAMVQALSVKLSHLLKLSKVKLSNVKLLLLLLV